MIPVARGDTYPNPVGYYLLVPFGLMVRALRKISARNQVWRTFNHLHILRNTMDHIQGLRSHRQTLVLRQPIQSCESSEYLVLPPQYLHEFLCHTLSMGNVYLAVHSLNLPCFISFVVKASTESNSIIILTMISVIIGVGGIVV